MPPTSLSCNGLPAATTTLLAARNRDHDRVVKAHWRPRRSSQARHRRRVGALIVSLSAVVFGGLIGVPFGAAVALTRFPGREAVIVILNALMGLPPVVVGLAIYLLLSRSGPLGAWGLLFTPQAMIVAQTVPHRSSRR